MKLGRPFRNAARAIVRRAGFSNYMSDELLRDLWQDLRNPGIGVRTRLWAYRRGFLACSVSEYGLTNDNFRDYEPDLHYYRLHPLNSFSFWIDDKLSFRYVLQPFSDYLPKYYYELRAGAPVKLMDCPADFGVEIESVIALLHRERTLALKPVHGVRGIGFRKLACVADRYAINGKDSNLNEVRSLLGTLDGYVVTEYLVSHEFMRNIYQDAPGTVRIMLVHNSNSEPHVAGAMFRIATSKTGTVDYGAQDGAIILAGIDLCSGQLFRPVQKMKNEYIPIAAHPDTNARIAGNIPHWNSIVEKVKDVARYLPQLRYMGFDVVVTPHSFKIIEINSHQGIHLMQQFYPLLRDPHVRALFGEHALSCQLGRP